MAWLVLIGIILAGSVFIYTRYKSSRLLFNRSNRRYSPRVPSAPNQNRRSSKIATGQIDWREIDSSTGANRIEWVNIEINSHPVAGDMRILIDDNFFNSNVPEDIENILRHIIRSQDPFSLDIFRPGERVYLCRRCRLAYHEDSWREIDGQCRDCGSAEYTRIYTLPGSIYFKNMKK